jgi:hypothetical protein
VLLNRQLRQIRISAHARPSAEAWRAFLSLVERSYREADARRAAGERALSARSQETRDLKVELRRCEANFKTLVDRSPDAIFVRSDRILYANPAMARSLGYDDPSDLVGRLAPEAFVHPADHAAVDAHRARVFEKGDTRPLRVRWIRRDGSVIAVRGVSASIIFNDEPALMTIARDITEKLRTEEERSAAAASLRASEARYRALFEGSPLPILLFDPDSLRILEVNPAAIALYGYGRAEFLGLTMRDLGAADGLGSMRPPAVDVPRETGSTGPVKHRKKDGTPLDVYLTAHAVTVDGESRTLATCADLTETRRLEEQLRQAQKMESVGRLAGGIAHDFNNVLAAILSYGQFCLNATRPEDPMHQDLEQIIRAGRRAAELTRQLLAFSRKQVLQPQLIVLNSLVTEVHTMLRHTIGEHVELFLDLEPSLWTVSADPGQITQVLMNLAVNARDAMPQGGRLTITTRNADLSAAEASSLGLAPGPYVAVATKDTGTGIDEQTMGHLFEPFFTTKEHGKGTGLGLATSFGIAKQSHGAIVVCSEPGQGATFTVYLPRAEAALESGTGRFRSIAPTRGAGRVLVVEDDASVREAVRRLLVERGFQVEVVSDVPEALRALERLASSVRFVMTDVVMPGGNGFALARRVRERWPDTPFLFMSGYADDTGALEAETLFLRKPFTPAELDEALRAIAGEIANRRATSRAAVVPGAG